MTRPDDIDAFYAWCKRFAAEFKQPPSERDAFNEGLRQGYDAAMKDFHGEKK